MVYNQPAKLTLSDELFDIWTDLYSDKYGPKETMLDSAGRPLPWWKQTLSAALENCEPTAGVVVSLSPAIVAVYTLRLDAVVMLKYDDEFASDNNWSVGSRLLFVNEHQKDIDYAPNSTDLVRGELAQGDASFVFPICAELLTDDGARVNELKTALHEDIWSRCEQLGAESAARKHLLPREGHPFDSQLPGSTSWLKVAHEYHNPKSQVQGVSPWRVRNYKFLTFMPFFLLFFICACPFTAMLSQGASIPAISSRTTAVALIPALIMAAVTRHFFPLKADS